MRCRGKTEPRPPDVGQNPPGDILSRDRQGAVLSASGVGRCGSCYAGLGSGRTRKRRFTIGVATVFASLLFAQADRSVWDGVYTEQQERRGADLYSNECASCHGLSLNGGESAPPLTGGEFLSNWSGLTAGDLFDRIRVSMPADRPGHLGRQQTADVLAHIFAVNQFPAGASELDTRSEVLKQIRIEAQKH